MSENKMTPGGVRFGPPGGPPSGTPEAMATAVDLRAEMERLRQENDYLKGVGAAMAGSADSETEALRSQVRTLESRLAALVEAGDAMAVQVNAQCGCDDCLASVKAWQRAKGQP